MLGKPAVDFINTMAIKAGACPIERSAFVRVTNQRIYTSNMKAVANMLLANAPLAPGPQLAAHNACPSAPPLGCSNR
jgi:hypothetical protein